MYIPRIRIRKRQFTFDPKEFEANGFDNKKPLCYYITGCACPCPPKGCDGNAVWHHFCVFWIDIRITNIYKFIVCRRQMNKQTNK